MGTGGCGVLLDAGGVLIGPVGGRWNPRHDFESVVLRHHPDLDPGRFPPAFAAGQRVLDAGAATVPRDRYHRALLGALGVAEPSGALLAELEAPLPGPVVETFPDVHPALSELAHLGVPMAVVSDAWSSLRGLLADVGLDRYFTGVVISEELGCRKPDPRMYQAGSALLGLPPQRCLFVDDDPALVAAADALGYQGVALVRSAPVPVGVRTVPALGHIVSLARAAC